MKFLTFSNMTLKPGLSHRPGVAGLLCLLKSQNRQIWYRHLLLLRLLLLPLLLLPLLRERRPSRVIDELGQLRGEVRGVDHITEMRCDLIGFDYLFSRSKQVKTNHT